METQQTKLKSQSGWQDFTGMPLEECIQLFESRIANSYYCSAQMVKYLIHEVRRLQKLLAEAHINVFNALAENTGVSLKLAHVTNQNESLLADRDLLDKIVADLKTELKIYTDHSEAPVIQEETTVQAESAVPEALGD
jgi:hypothetical protein